MQGIVRGINPTTGMAALQTEDGEFTVFECLGGSVDREDLIVGNLNSLGSNEWVNETRRQRLSVYVQDIHASVEVARQMMSRT
jgi:hypothetical protein